MRERCCGYSLTRLTAICRQLYGFAMWEENGGQRGNRTPDTRIFNPLLYQLSYLATHACSAVWSIPKAPRLGKCLRMVWIIEVFCRIQRVGIHIVQFDRRHRIAAGEPAIQVHTTASRRTERPLIRRRWLTAYWANGTHVGVVAIPTPAGSEKTCPLSSFRHQ